MGLSGVLERDKCSDKYGRKGMSKMPHFPRETCLQYWKYFIQITAEKLIFCRLNVSVYTEKNFYDSFYTLKERVSYADS